MDMQLSLTKTQHFGGPLTVIGVLNTLYRSLAYKVFYHNKIIYRRSFVKSQLI